MFQNVFFKRDCSILDLCKLVLLESPTNPCPPNDKGDALPAGPLRFELSLGPIQMASPHIIARTEPKAFLTQNNPLVVGILDVQGMRHSLSLWQVVLSIQMHCQADVDNSLGRYSPNVHKADSFLCGFFLRSITTMGQKLLWRRLRCQRQQRFNQPASTCSVELANGFLLVRRDGNLRDIIRDTRRVILGHMDHCGAYSNVGSSRCVWSCSHQKPMDL